MAITNTTTSTSSTISNQSSTSEIQSDIFELPTVASVLQGSTILVTGAAGFVGTALLFRLLTDPSFGGPNGVKRVLAIIRGDTVEEATLRLPELLRPFAAGEDPLLIVLNGDCQKPNLGLTGKLLNHAQNAEIVIHAAGDTRFTLSMSEAVASICDLGYSMARFSLVNYRTKTHIHLSTTFVSWFLPNGGVVHEEFLQEGLDPDVSNHESHVNTYLHAKTLSEGCVNALFTPQAGRAVSGKTARIMRLATVGPSVAFPRPGWGSGHPSSPVCAALAAVEVTKDHFQEGSCLDVIPIDIAVNQILAMTASAHSTHKLPKDHVLSPKNSLNPLNLHGTNVPCYNISSGLPASHNIWIETLNDPECKIEEPYIPEKNIVKVYRPFMSKVVDFDTTRTRAVLSIELPASVAAAAMQSTRQDTEQALVSSSSSSSSGSSGDHDTDFSRSHPASSTTSFSLDSDVPSLKPMPARMTSHNLASCQLIDPRINCSDLEVDVAESVSTRYGSLGNGGKDNQAWKGYLKMCAFEMSQKGPRKDWISYVD